MKDLIHVTPLLLKQLHNNSVIVTGLNKDFLALVCNVAGMQFYDIKEIKKFIEVDQKVELKREAKNEYDTLAVAVYLKDTQIGHLPRTKNETIARLMDGGKQFYGTIIGIEDNGVNQTIEINIYLID